MNWTEVEYQAYLARQQGQPPRLPRPVLLAEDMAPEWRFQARVVEVAEAQGWRCFHAHTNKRNRAGFPDLVLSRPGQLLLIELKTNAGVVEPEQQAWLAVLHHPPWVIAEVWRPADWSETVLPRLGYGGG